jgi:hypothetical protein
MIRSARAGHEFVVIDGQSAPGAPETRGMPGLAQRRDIAPMDVLATTSAKSHIPSLTLFRNSIAMPQKKRRSFFASFPDWWCSPSN